MKGYRVKKIVYSITAAIMVLVLSLPTVAKASSTVPVHTYESIKDTYTSGTWQDYSLEIIFGMTNGNYEYYRRGFENLPASLDSSKYYFMYVKGYNFYITYINTSDYGCLFAYDVYYDDDVNTDYSVSLDRMIGIHSSYMDRLSDSDSISTYIISTLSACCSGTFTTYSLNCYSEDYDWECMIENEEISQGPGKDSIVGGVAFSAVLVATNMDLFSNYEFGMYSGDNGIWRNQLNEMTYDEVMEVVPNLTNLNQGLKYYDGENIVGGAPNFDNSLCFDTYLVELVNDPRLTGEKGVRLKYSMGEKLFDTVYGNPQWQLEMDFTITYSLAEYDNGFFSGGGVTIYDDVITMTLYSELDSYITQDGSYIFDFSKMNDSDKLLYYLFLTENVDKSNSILGGKLGQSIIDAIDGKLANSASIGLSADKYYQPNYFDVACEIRMINDDLGIKSNSSWGHVNLKTYENNSYCNQYDEETGESSPGSTNSGSNYYNVVTETDNDGNTYQNYYYYDTTNNTVTPSINTSGTLNLVHTFANSLNITGISSGGSGGSGGSSSSLIGSGDGVDITIEDDDYTDTALREDLRDGFGLLDNMNTDESSDGFLQLSAKFYEHLDGDLDDMLVFGMSSVIVIAILLMALRR